MKNITKKVTMVLFAICMMAAAGAVSPASTVKAEKEGNWTYDVINDSEAEITGYTGKQTKITIPKTLKKGQYKVTSIGYCAFLMRPKLKSISIPSSVKKIKGMAFCGCTGLKSIKLPSNLTSIGEQAFAGCDGLKSVKIPDKVTKIEEYAFAECKNLESITIGKKVKKIGKYIFWDAENEAGCNKLKKITIKSTCLTSVGKDALKGINAYATIKVPKAKLSKYKKLFTSKTGYKKTMKITK